MSYDTNEFRDWLRTAMKEGGVDNQTSLAAASALGQSVIGSYLSGAKKPERRDQVEKLVRALLPPGGGDLDAAHLLADGLRAAGLAPASTAQITTTGPLAGAVKADHEVIVYLRGKPADVQDRALRILKAVFDDDPGT